MRKILKQLFYKNSDLNRRLSGLIQKAFFRDETLLICSLFFLGLAMFAYGAFRFGLPRVFWAMPLTCSILYGPTFGPLAVIDILKRGWTRWRFFALLCSAAGIALVAVTIHDWIRHLSAA